MIHASRFAINDRQGFVPVSHQTRGKFAAKHSARLASGFTMIELLVAIGVFSVVVAIAVGGFVRALRTERQVAGLLSANGNVSLALEQMAREIRTGYDFCVNGQTCAPNALSFKNANGSIATYCFDEQNQTLLRGIGGGSCGGPNFNKIIANNVAIKYLVFLVSGNGNTDGYAPEITIAIGVSAKQADLAASVVNLETTVSARVLDG